MYVVTVEFVVIAGRGQDFLQAMVANARTSREVEPGCRQFDVCVDPDDPLRVFLLRALRRPGGVRRAPRVGALQTSTPRWRAGSRPRWCAPTPGATPRLTPRAGPELTWCQYESTMEPVRNHQEVSMPVNFSVKGVRTNWPRGCASVPPPTIDRCRAN